MARLARIVVPGHPHHVTQRGNRGMDTFLREADYARYLELLANGCGEAGTDILAYCLMPNHVHLILVPGDEDGLRGALGDAHRRYTRHVNLREGWRGHLWQERFHSFPMDEAHLVMAARYIELNPVRAGLAKRAKQWRWSSARAHLAGRDDGVVSVGPLLELIDNWKKFLAAGLDDDVLETVRRHERTGRPLGSPDFVEALEARTGRTLGRAKPGPKPGSTRKPKKGGKTAKAG